MEAERWKIGVEPVMFFYMSAFMVTSVVEEAFFVDKACRVNLNFSSEICDNLNDERFKEEHLAVQIKVSSFHQYENIAHYAIPIVLAFFLGSWSDKVGRKIPMLLGLSGNLIYSSMVVVNALMDDWPVEIVLLTASLPCALTGGNLTVFMSAFSYLSDTTTHKQRTFRTTMLEVAYLFPMPVGVAIGSYLFYNVVNKSFAAMFLVNASLLVVAILFAWIFMEWKTAEGQDVADGKFLWGLIDLNHAADSFKTVFKPRDENRRFYLFLALFAMALYTFQRDEKHMVYLYTTNVFNWNVSLFSKFRTYQSSIFVAGLLLGGPLLSKVFSLRDMMIMIVGATSHFVTRIVFAQASEPSSFYIGATFAFFGPLVAPVIRSFVSKLVPPSERGKVFAILSVADMTVPLVSGFIYSQVYNATLRVHPESIFYVTAITQAGVFFIALFINIMLNGENLNQINAAFPSPVDDEAPIHVGTTAFSSSNAQNVK